MIDAFFAWSGGKDSALALYRVQQQGQYRVKYLLTTVNEAHNRVTMHGVRLGLLEVQAQATGIPLKIVWVPENPSMEIYAARMAAAILEMKAEGINTAIFGDIFLADLRKYREEQMSNQGIRAVFPLWEENSTTLVQEFMALGFKAKLICVSHDRLGRSFINRTLNQTFLQDLPAGVDPAGENGEYHSFVYAGPLFSFPINFKEGNVIFRDYAPTPPPDTAGTTASEKGVKSQSETPTQPDSRFWFADLIPVSAENTT